MVVALGLSALAIWPCAQLFAAVAGQWGDVRVQLASPQMLTLVRHTVVSSLLATLLAVSVGLLNALAVRTLREPGRGVWMVASTSPLMVPPFVGAFSWMQAYARAGLTELLWHWHGDFLYGRWGVVLLLAVHTAPLAFLAFTAVFSRENEALWRATRVSGGSGWDAFVHTLWPSLRPVLAATASLLFAFDAGDFGIPLLLGLPGRYPTMTTQIYEDLSYATMPGAFAQAVALAGVLAFMSLTFLTVAERLGGTGSWLRWESPGLPRPPAPWAWEWGSRALLGGYLVVVLVFPFAALILTALTRAYGLPPVPANWTWAHFAGVLQGTTGQAVLHSLVLSAVAAAAVVGAGLLLTEVGLRHALGRLAQRLVWVPYALPGSVVAIGVLIAFGRYLYGTLAIIGLAYFVKFWGTMEPLRGLRAAIDPAAAQAARILGAKPLDAYRLAVWPSLGPLAGSLGILVFIGALYELTMSSLLYTPATQTLAVVVLNAQQAGDVSTTAALGSAIALALGVGLAAIAIIRRCAGSGNG
ncbi:MAG: ABC transporter permease subunit [Firmicutes bacterium]|nr:ABC transporter permease subunit [Bacillota bacterium]